jgi:protein-L-isoaspartate(D-aspartate) O-methyltransferase
VINARKILDQLHYHNVVIKVFDGTYGWPEESPFDGIIVTAAAPRVPEPYLRQLALHGRLVIPVGDRFSQTLLRISKTEQGIVQEDLGGVRFVSLIGDHGWQE